jgi:hypothetical protein
MGKVDPLVLEGEGSGACVYRLYCQPCMCMVRAACDYTLYILSETHWYSRRSFFPFLIVYLRFGGREWLTWQIPISLRLNCQSNYMLLTVSPSVQRKADSYFVAHPDAELKLGRRSLRAECALSVMNWLITFHPERITCVRERIAWARSASEYVGLEKILTLSALLSYSHTLQSWHLRREHRFRQTKMKI